MLIIGVLVSAAVAGCGTYAAEAESGQDSISAAAATDDASAADATASPDDASAADTAAAADAAATAFPQANEQARVSYLGPEGTYTEEAAQFFFPEASAMMPETTVPEAIADVVEGKADYAVIPQENTLGG
ncbi:MAG: prephenate dehydratase domain-containing protein, partial [Lachnospiraceae bacterium]|nr:prephenate dehydratase domain-containing protein [Lachnospiraceae bacterium]